MKTLNNTIAILIVQMMILSNVCFALDARQNLSPQLQVEQPLIHNLFSRGLPQLNQPEKIEKEKMSLLQKLTEYAIRKKEENKDKGFFRQNLVYLLLKGRVARIEQRSKPYKVKNKQRKKAVNDLAKLKTQLEGKARTLGKEKFRDYQQRLNALEDLLDNISTYGEWEDFISQGAKLSKEINKHGALARELKSLKEKQQKQKSRKKTNRKKRIIKQQLAEEVKQSEVNELTDTDAEATDDPHKDAESLADEESLEPEVTAPEDEP